MSHNNLSSNPHCRGATRAHNELDDDRDKAAFELKQAHGKVMAAMRSCAIFKAVKQERQQYADDINVLKEHKSELEAELREQEARHDQENLANSEKLQLLEQAESRLKQQFELLANQLFESKTAKVDQQNKQSLEGFVVTAERAAGRFKSCG